MNTFYDNYNSVSLSNELFNNSQNSLELEDWRKELEKNIEKNSENAEKLENSLYKNSKEMSKFKIMIEDFEKKAEELNTKFTKMANFEKLIAQLVTQITNMKNNNITWQSEFLKNMNDFNEKIMNQEILLDSFEKFENLTTKKIEIICSELKKIPIEIKKDKEEVIFYLFFILKYFHDFLLFFIFF
jgi:hypothetical protein